MNHPSHPPSGYPPSSYPGPGYPPPPRPGPSAGKVVLIVLGTLGVLVFGSCAVCTAAVGAGAEKAEERRVQARAEQEAKVAECAKTPEVPWSSLAAALQENEARVVASWKGACAKVTGVVDNIGSGLGDTPYVVIGTGERFSLQNLHCKPADPQAALNLSKGQSITVWGVGGGEIMGSLVLDDCQW